jgi:tRNA threonylcarbamoyladenosine biosynthesis protein TsaE
MKIISRSEKHTLDIGKKIAANLVKGDIICLWGQLGSGKTVLAKGISSGLGIKKDEVISPTFVLMRCYAGRIPVYHFDLYRLSQPEDIINIGYEEFLFGDGISIIEWADRLMRLLPQEFLKIELRVSGENQRSFKFTAQGKRHKELLEKINADIGS